MCVTRSLEPLLIGPTIAKSGTSRITVDPAATSAQRPMVTGATHTALAPIEAPSSTVTPTGVQSDASLAVPSVFTARGKWSLVKTAAGPMKAPEATFAGS